MKFETTKPPAPRRDWALFLDIDGTLLEIAATPDAVVVPAGLPATLEAVSARLGGALAVISGRPMAAIDRLLAPLALPCAAEHGAVIRLPDGKLLEPGAVHHVPDAWLARIEAAVRKWPGVVVDRKAYSVALHYRLAPERQSDVLGVLEELASDTGDHEIIAARMAYELRHRRLHKGAAVHRFMKTKPFAGRIPVFVGDDVTDEDGFHACRELGGMGLHVEQMFGGQPANVRAWLAEFGEEPCPAS